MPRRLKARTIKPGRVKKIIKPPFAGAPEKAEIAIDGADELYREIRIENRLQDRNGNTAKLKPDAEVQVEIKAEPEAVVSEPHKSDPDADAVLVDE